MARKKETKEPKPTSPEEKERREEEKLLEEHPFETMSQIQNRYGQGREQSGSEGEKGADRLNH